MKLNMNYKELVERKVELAKLIDREKDKEKWKQMLLELADIEESLYMLETTIDPDGQMLDILSMSRARVLSLAGDIDGSIKELDRLISITKRKDVKYYAQKEREKLENDKVQEFKS